MSTAPKKKELRMRLIFAIPFILTSFVILSGLLIMGTTIGRIQGKFMIWGQIEAILYIVLWILAMGGVALIVGIILAYAIANPLKKLTKQAIFWPLAI